MEHECALRELCYVLRTLCCVLHALCCVLRALRYVLPAVCYVLRALRCVLRALWRMCGPARAAQSGDKRRAGNFSKILRAFQSPRYAGSFSRALCQRQGCQGCHWAAQKKHQAAALGRSIRLMSCQVNTFVNSGSEAGGQCVDQ